MKGVLIVKNHNVILIVPRFINEKLCKIKNNEILMKK